MKEKLSKINWKALWEAIKEPLRLLLLAIIGFIISQLLEVKNPEQWVIGAVFVLRFIDKWMHEVGKDRDSSKLSGGLTRF